MTKQRSSRLVGLLLGTFLLGLTVTTSAQQNPDSVPTDTNPPAKAVPTALDDLSLKQGQVADKYRRLEELIFKMADYESAGNPRRSALLKQAYKQSKDRLTASQLSSIARLLNQEQFKRAIDGQETAQQDLEQL